MTPWKLTRFLLLIVAFVVAIHAGPETVKDSRSSEAILLNRSPVPPNRSIRASSSGLTVRDVSGGPNYRYGDSRSTESTDRYDRNSETDRYRDYIDRYYGRPFSYDPYKHDGTGYGSSYGGAGYGGYGRYSPAGGLGGYGTGLGGYGAGLGGYGTGLRGYGGGLGGLGGGYGGYGGMVGYGGGYRGYGEGYRGYGGGGSYGGFGDCNYNPTSYECVYQTGGYRGYGK